MKIMFISPKNRTLFNFRGDLIKSIISKNHEVIAIGPNKDYLEDVLALGVKFQEIPFSKDNTSIFGDINYYRRLKNIIKKEKPDLVFCYTIKPVIYGTLAAHNAGVKNIYPMMTGLGRVYGANNLKAKLLRIITGLLFKYTLKNAKKVIFQNSDDLESFVKMKYLTSDKAELVNGSGVNMKRFISNGLPQDPVFLMVSRLIQEKGVLEYLQAARIVKKKHPKARFILLGGYDYSIGAIQPDEIEPYIKDGSIEFFGETNDVIPFLDEAKVFVLPTYYREGLPRTILEAMAMAKPVITTDWPGCRDAVVHGVNGFLVPPKDSTELANKMIFLIENNEANEKMSKNSLKLCKEKYDVDIVNKRMLEIMNIN